ncbi:MAG TPA: hypothetical protein VFH82_06175, partial [Gemmatimonadota bacterium]|nr:hypothetical protein [Gemmatimonadota bacterium]
MVRKLFAAGHDEAIELPVEVGLRRKQLQAYIRIRQAHPHRIARPRVPQPLTVRAHGIGESHSLERTIVPLVPIRHVEDALPVVEDDLAVAIFVEEDRVTLSDSEQDMS